MIARELILIVLQVSIMATVFGFGLAATLEDLLYLRRRPALLARSLVAVFVLMPVVAVALFEWLHFPQTTEIALIALAMCPVPPLLPIRQAKAGGRVSFGLGLTIVLSFAAIVTIPLTVAVLRSVFDRPYAVTPAAVARVLLKTTLLPLASGVIVRARWPSLSERLERPVRLLGSILLPLSFAALVVGAFPEIWAAVGNGSVLAIVVFTITGLSLGHVLGGPKRTDSVVLAFSTACRHPVLALSIATTVYPEQQFGAIMLLYLLVSVVAGLPYLLWQRRRAASTPGGLQSVGDSGISESLRK
jgi:bile acid:Na+ symporter, BASS family